MGKKTSDINPYLKDKEAINTKFEFIEKEIKENKHDIEKYHEDMISFADENKTKIEDKINKTSQTINDKLEKIKQDFLSKYDDVMASLEKLSDKLLIYKTNSDTKNKLIGGIMRFITNLISLIIAAFALWISWKNKGG